MGRFSKNRSRINASSARKFSRLTYLSIRKMPLTEAQRLAFLKGREKRMANLEKKKLEQREASDKEILDMIEEEMQAEMDAQDMPPPKPKVKRQTNTAAKKKAPVKVKVNVEPDPSEAETEPETDPETEGVKASAAPAPTAKEPEPEPAVSASSSSSSSAFEFDQDAFANKVVDLFLSKGYTVRPQEPVDLKPPSRRKAASSAKPKDKAVKPKKSDSAAAEPPVPAFAPSIGFSWL